MNISGSFKRYVFTFLLAVITFIFPFVASAQNDIVIGGGSDVGALLCEGKVYTWGRGVTSPTLVAFPAGAGTIKQVSAGSGSHFLAVDCDGKVYSWGVNDRGQVGNGTTADEATPKQVRGIGGTGFLTNVASVAGGTNTSFAILNTGEVVSWGYNTLGQLGSGAISTTQLTPVYVMSGPGTRLTNVIQVLAGDAATYALLKDGSVVSWGSTGFDTETNTVAGWGLLGRNLNGTAGNPGATLQSGSDPYARPVYLNATTRLTGITAIGAGDVFAMALSADGHVYSWGHDAWGGSTGTSNCAAPGQGNGADFTNPKLVTAGAARGTAADDGNGYLLAKSIAAGRGFAMAVTTDGRPVAWGNGGCTEASGGCLGNGVTQSCYPRYINSGGTTHNDVLAITRGDTWGYYVRQNGSIYTFGANEAGKLGIGNTNNQATAVVFNAPCAVHIKPTAKISPRDTTLCAEKAFSITLNAGFNIGTALRGDYTITWYKNGVAIAGYPGTIAAKGLTLSATDTAEYKVRISFTGSNKPCGEKDAVDSIKISAFKKNFTIPATGPPVNYPTAGVTYCSNTDAWVIGNGVYSWYRNATGGTPIATTTKNQRLQIPISNFNAPVADQLTIYVEESSKAAGRVGNTTAPCNNDNKLYNSGPTTFNHIFTVSENLTIDTVSIREYMQNNSSGTSLWTVSIYGVKTVNGKQVIDVANLIGSGPQNSFARVNTTTQDKDTIRNIRVGVKLTPGTYALALTAGNASSVTHKYESCSGVTLPLNDNLTSHALTITAYDQGPTNGSNNSNYGAPTFNWRFHTDQGYCKRFPVVLGLNCPCNKPTNVDIKNTKALSVRCIGDTLTLKGDYKNAGKTLTNTGMYFVWYKQGASPVAADYTLLTAPSPVTSVLTYPVGNRSLSPVALTTSGVWVLRVQDGNNPTNVACYTEDTVTVKVGDRPNRPRYTGDTTLCIGERLDLTAASPAKTGVTIKQYTWKNLTAGVTAGGTLNARITKNNVVAADGTTFKAIVESTEGCKDSSTVTVRVDAAPAKPTFAGDSSLCPKQALNIVATSAGTPAATKYKWTFPATTVAPRADTINDPLNNTLSKAQVVASDGGRYKVVAISALGCKDSATVGIVVNPLPARPGLTGDSLLCEGSNLSLTAASATTAGVTISNYVWKKPTASTATASGGQGQTMGKTGVAATEAGRYEVVAVSSEGCRDSSRVNVKIDAKPTVPVISTNGGADIIMCGSDQQLAIDPASYTVGKVKWTNDKSLAFSDAISNKADTLKTTKAIGFVNNTGTAEFTVTVTNGICPAVTDKIKVTRSGELTAPNLVSDNGKLTVCLNGSLSFTGNARSTANLEVSGWSWSPKNTNITVDTTGANSNKAKFTFTAVGSYDIIYTIDNPTCPAKTEKLTVTVVAPPTAVITDPNTLNGNIKEKSINPNNYQLAAQTVGTGYTGTWTKKSGQGTIGASTGTLTGLGLFETNPSTGVGTTEVIWTVTENTSSCPAAKDSARIIRRDITIPNLGPDTVKCESVLPFTRKTNAGDIIPGIETIAWFGQTSFVSGTNIVIPAGTAPGTYQVRLEITNTPANLVSKDTFNIRVDAESVVPTLSLVGTKANPYLICSEQFTMPGIATAQGPLSVNWWNKISGTGKLTDSLLVNTSMTGISGLDTVTARFWNKNGVCPAKSIDFVLKKVGDITATEVKLDGTIAGGKTYTNEILTLTKLADTLCLGGTYTLSAIKLPAASETGTWRVVSGTSVSLGSPLIGNTQSLTVNSIGSTVIEWKIENASLASCNPNTLQVTLVVQAPPTVTSVVGPTSPPCEDDAVNVANGRVFFTSTLKNAQFNWTLVPGGTGSATLLTNKDSLVTFTNFVSTATKGTKDSVNFSATVSNACGTDVEPLKVVFNLKPRELYVGDTISGPTIICESWPGVGYLFDHVQPNTTNIRWYWNSTLQTTTPNLGQTDTAGYYRNKAWGDVSVVTNATVLAQLGNVCGYGKDTTLAVQVIPAVDFDFKVVSDRFDQVNNSFCVPLDVVGIFALQTSPDSSVQGNVAQYEFTNKANTVFKALSPSRTFYSSFAHDTTVVVNATPYESACLNDYAIKSKEIRLTGYDKPLDSLAAVIDTICEDQGNGKVLLSLVPNPPTRNRGNITWYKSETGGPVAVGTGASYEVSGPSEGTYYASIENALKLIDPSTTCPGSTTKEAKVKIYDKPDPVFATDLLVIYYNENDPGVQMPLLETGTVDEIIYKHYDNGVWLSSQDSLLPIIKTTRDEMTMEYLLTLHTGNEKAGAVCKGEAIIKVLNALPLRIPNAFSPNNDGKNETWVIDGLNKYRDVKVRVFNRWGNSMFTDQDGVYEPWDGRTNGADLASGTYYYVIDLKGSPDGTDDVKVGSLTLVR